MQITTGKVFVNAGSADVEGNSSVDWSQVLPGNLLIISSVIYTIATVDSEAQTLTLTSPYQGTSYPNTGAGTDYVIARDFTSSQQLPLLNEGDLEAAALFRRAMAIVDQALAVAGTTTGSAVDATVTTVSPHGFVVGNILKKTSGSSWALLSSNDDVTANVPIGAVIEVVSSTSFVLRCTGLVGTSGAPVQGINFWDGASSALVPGTVYYVRGSAIAIPGGGGTYCNLTTNTGGAWTYVGSSRIPVLVADSASSGYLITLASAQSGVFSTSAPGLVPAPSSDDVTAQRLLCADGVFRSTGVANGSLDAIHLKNRADVDWSAFEAQSSGVDIFSHIMDLQERLGTLEGPSFTARRKRINFYNRKAGGTPGASPAYVFWSPPSALVTAAYLTFQCLFGVLGRSDSFDKIVVWDSSTGAILGHPQDVFKAINTQLKGRVTYFARSQSLYVPIAAGERLKIWLPNISQGRAPILVFKELSGGTLQLVYQTNSSASGTADVSNMLGGAAEASQAIVTSNGVMEYVNSGTGAAWSGETMASPLEGCDATVLTESAYRTQRTRIQIDSNNLPAVALMWYQ